MIIKKNKKYVNYYIIFIKQNKINKQLYDNYKTIRNK